jgi:dTDP-glucose 4,6-dehydratase
VKIIDVAHTLIRMSGRRDIDIVFTGLRAGEKLGEELFSHQEVRRSTSHPLVSSVAVPLIEGYTVQRTGHESAEDCVSWMRERSRERSDTRGITANR